MLRAHAAHHDAEQIGSCLGRLSGLNNPARLRWPLEVVRRWCAEVAQLVEQRIENPCVGSSNLPLGTIFSIKSVL